MGKAWSAPISTTVRTALDALLAERPGLGAAWLFPSPKSRQKPVSRWLAAKWLRRAEQLAEMPRQDGSLWHAYRRKWGTERKHLPACATSWNNVRLIPASRHTRATRTPKGNR